MSKAMPFPDDADRHTAEIAALRHDIERSIVRETEHVNRIEELETYHEKLAALGKIAAQNRRENFHSERKLEARIADLEKALEPFVASAKRLGLDILHFDEWPNYVQVALRVTAEDVRRALLVSAQGQGDRTASVSDQREL